VPSIASAPFDVEQAKQHQEAWAKHLGVPVELTNSTGIKLRLIPPGKFQMGSTPEELDQLKQELDQNGASDFDKFVAQSSGPLHVVEVSTAFYISQYELTVAQFRRFVEATNYQPSAEQKNASHFTWKNFASVSDTEEKQPVCGVSWDDANAFCVWLSQQTQQTYRLPTEAQWEYACRAGSQTLWGSCNNASALSEYAIVEQSGTPHPASIGLRRANAFGLFDMHGNVDEWCLDWHNKDFYGRSPLVDPAYLETPKDGGSGRVSRGGSWNARAWWSRCATRSYDFPTVPTFPKGFRVVLKVDTPKNTTTE
jgi:formylglycine-generating enzyme required for sulfatase activity